VLILSFLKILPNGLFASYFQMRLTSRHLCFLAALVAFALALLIAGLLLTLSSISVLISSHAYHVRCESIL
jgi:hypothetical protein